MDIDSISPGTDYVDVVNGALTDCDVVLPIIGPRWLTAESSKGQRRLDNPHDFVRLEIEAALAGGVRVIPVLVGGAEMPEPGEIPESLVPLVRRNAFELSDRRWRPDVSELLRVLEGLETNQGTSAAIVGSTQSRDSVPEPISAGELVQPDRAAGNGRVWTAADSRRNRRRASGILLAVAVATATVGLGLGLSRQDRHSPGRATVPKRSGATCTRAATTATAAQPTPIPKTIFATNAVDGKLISMNNDGSGQHAVEDQTSPAYDVQILSDGRVAYATSNPTNIIGNDVGVLRVTCSSVGRVLGETWALTADGNSIAMDSGFDPATNESHIDVGTTANNDVRTLYTTHGSIAAEAWSHDGRTLHVLVDNGVDTIDAQTGRRIRACKLAGRFRSVAYPSAQPPALADRRILLFHVPDNPNSASTFGGLVAVDPITCAVTTLIKKVDEGGFLHVSEDPAGQHILLLDKGGLHSIEPDGSSSPLMTVSTTGSFQVQTAAW